MSIFLDDKESILELKELLSLARTSGDWKLTNKPKIYLEKDFVAKVNMTFVVKTKKEQVSKLETLGFEVDKNIQLIGKYGRTNNEIKEKFQDNYLSHPIIFEEIKLTQTEKKETPMVLEVLAKAIGVPLIIVDTVIL